MNFVPADFEPPIALDGPGFRLEPLGAAHNERDHIAWMASIDHIHSTPGFEDPDEWPKPMSLEKNLADLVRHAEDFEKRTGFTYSVLDGDDVIGCLYIYPSDREAHDAHLSSWVTETRSELDQPLWQTVTAWLGDTWPFTDPLYASRDS